MTSRVVNRSASKPMLCNCSASTRAFLGERSLAIVRCGLNGFLSLVKPERAISDSIAAYNLARLFVSSSCKPIQSTRGLRGEGKQPHPSISNSNGAPAAPARSTPEITSDIRTREISPRNFKVR